MLNILKNRLIENYSNKALIAENIVYSYEELFNAVILKELLFKKSGIKKGSIIVLIGDFSFNSISSLIAIFFCEATVIPLTEESNKKLSEQIAKLNPDFIVNSLENNTISNLKQKVNYRSQNLRKIIPTQGGGLIVFTSGSTGTPKGIVHSLEALCYRYVEKKPPLTSICFLQFDHMGGINTLLFLLFRGGTAVQLSNRSTHEICCSIEKNKVQLLPTTPSFLTQLLISKSFHKYDLSSLKVVSYGTEVMSEAILKKMNEILPNCIFKQTYGLSETGVLQILSKSSNSLWFKFIDNGLDYKIVDNILWLKTKSNYLAKFTFDETDVLLEKRFDDWFCTNDLVDVDGNFLKIRGRSTDIINVGGLKVYPGEVENCIYELEFVHDVTVSGKKNPLIGQMVVANIHLLESIEPKVAEKLIRAHCLVKLEKFKIPSQIKFNNKNFVNDRFKKVRNL
ncbi:fatty acid--CoA ligase family protein [Alphaproteobacteria bacterium]|nr:fatty acid--CoA ligase family protein [Alphaproteobacteria bacterium]